MHLSAAAHEAGERHREIGPRTERLERWEVRRQPVDDELKETLWNREAPEPMFSQVSEGQAGRQLVGGKRPGCVGDEDLASMSDCGDPRGLVHIEAHICATGQATFTSMESHPNPDGSTGRPLVRGQGALRVGGRGHGVRRQGEDGKEGIALIQGLDPVVVADGPAHDLVMLSEDAGPAIPQPTSEIGRPLDVGEEEGDRPRGKLRHAPLPTSYLRWRAAQTSEVTR